MSLTRRSLAGSERSSAGERLKGILQRLKRAYPHARCALEHTNPLELLVATILSAQCTDERVNRVTRGLFRRYRTARDYARADLRTLEGEIRSTGFYRSKARHILGAAKVLDEKHDGRVPSTMEELLELPGVARKTANVVLGTAFGRAEGIVVDTHVRRVARRLALTHEEDPVRIERDLMAQVPREEWISFSHRLIWHGRLRCAARNPRCGDCPVAPYCPSAGRIDKVGEDHEAS